MGQVIAPPYSSPGAGTNSEAFGRLATAAGANGVALGYNASAGHSGCVMIGSGVQSSAADATAVGYQAAAGIYSVGLGYAASVAGTGVGIGKSVTVVANSSVAIGYQANVSSGETSSVVIGYQASADGSVTGGGEETVIGALAYGTSWRGTAVGYKAKVAAVSGTALGRGALASHSHCVAIGRGAWTNAANQVCIGYSGADAATDVFFEAGHTHKYVDYPDGATITRVPASTPIVIHGFDAYDATDGLATSVAGGPLRLAGGRGTGTAAGGSVVLQVAPAGGSSNNTKNTLVDGLTIAATTGAPATFLTTATATRWIGTTGTITTSQPVLDLSQTWNAGAVTFTGIKLNVTNTASAAASMMVDLQVGGTTVWNVTRTGATVMAPDTDEDFAFGRTKISSFGDDTMYLSHYDRASGSAYAVKQNSSGNTAVNGVSGVDFTTNNDYTRVYLSLQQTFLKIFSNTNLWIHANTTGLGFFNTTPVAQPSGAAQAALTDSTTGTAGSTLVDVTASHDQAKLNNNFATLYALVAAIRTGLVNTGLIKGSA